MDRKSIKEDGILEQYLLGELSEKEAMEVTTILDEDAALRAYFENLEADFEHLAFENAIEPDAAVKTKLMKAATTAEQATISLATKKKSSFNFPIAASIAACLLLSSIWLYTNWKNAETNVDSLQNKTSDLEQRIERLEGDLAGTKKQFQEINQPSMTKLVLKGNAVSPNSVAVVYVDHTAKKVLLDPQGLSQLDQDHDYQLWADVEGEMINMGVISSEDALIAMTYIEHAESLNITIEPKGGNDHPTVERLISNVYL